MKKKVIYILIFLIAVILQTSLLPVWANANSVGDGVLMLILAWSIIDGFSGFFGWSIFFGILYDLLTYSRIGVHVLIFLITVYFVSFFSRRFSVDLKGVGLLLFLIFVVVIWFISHLIIVFGFALDATNANIFLNSFASSKFMFLQLFSDAILFVLWFLLIKKTKDFFAIEA